MRSELDALHDAERVFILSPHRDDAVFSCGALLWMLRERGVNVLVINVFTEFGESPPSTPFAHSIMTYAGPDPTAATERRRQEDLAALRVLNCQEVSLGICDAVCRRSAAGDALYPGEADLTRLKCEDVDRTVPAIVTQLDAVLREGGSPRLILAPAAIGGHVDHTICALACGADGGRVVYYEDVPYALSHKDRPVGMRWRIELSRAAFDAQIAAARRYVSQVQMIWPSETACEASLRAHFGAASWAPYAQTLYALPLNHPTYA